MGEGDWCVLVEMGLISRAFRDRDAFCCLSGVMMTVVTAAAAMGLWLSLMLGCCCGGKGCC